MKAHGESREMQKMRQQSGLGEAGPASCGLKVLMTVTVREMRQGRSFLESEKRVWVFALSQTFIKTAADN